MKHVEWRSATLHHTQSTMSTFNYTDTPFILMEKRRDSFSIKNINWLFKWAINVNKFTETERQLNCGPIYGMRRSDFVFIVEMFLLGV